MHWHLTQWKNQTRKNNHIQMIPNKETIKSAITDRLKNIYDPEIPVNIYDLGLIYNIDIEDGLKVNVLMTLTAPNCPVAESLPLEIKNNLSLIEGVSSVNVEITFNPPWNMDNMTDEAKLELGLL